MPRVPKTKKKKTERQQRRSFLGPISFTDYLDHLDRENIQGILHNLWKNWPAIKKKLQIEFGEPLGHQKKTLIMGCEDSIEVQELRMHEQDILKVVNEFLGSRVFSKLRVELMLGKAPVTQAQTLREQSVWQDEPPEHQAKGTYLKNMDPNSAIARCYARYLKKQSPEKPLES
ncbi:MAG: DUF721 domain-containing protein [Desulfovibrio sp.]|nr:DUF721 domain-containing protein [Desulfovibrio sp.]